MKTKLKYLPFLVLLFFVLHMIYSIYFQEASFSSSKIIGVVLFSIVCILYFVDNYRAEFLLLISLLLGTLNIATFSHHYYYFNFGTYLSIDIVCIVLLVIHFLLNKNEIFEVVDQLRED
jgi:hypothetical protein